MNTVSPATPTRKRRRPVPPVAPVNPWQWLGLARASLWRLVALLALVWVSGVIVIHQTHRQRVLFSGLQQQRAQANQLQVEWGQLLIEQSTFAQESRIALKAAEELQLRVPSPDSIVVVTRDD